MKSPQFPAPGMRFRRVVQLVRVNKLIRGRLPKRLICLVLLFTFLIWPAPGAAYVLVDVGSNAVRSSTVTLATDSARFISYALRFSLWSSDYTTSGDDRRPDLLRKSDYHNAREDRCLHRSAPPILGDRDQRRRADHSRRA